MDLYLRERLTPAPTIVIVGAPEFVGQLRQDVMCAGLRPICAQDGREALEAITHEKPAMVVIDSALPDIHRRWLMDRMERSPALARIPRAVLPGQALAAT